MTREEFRDYVDFLRSQDEISYDVYSGLIDGIDTLEQEPQTGHWIYDYTSADGHKTYHCSKCGCYLQPKHSEPLNNFKWCSLCGARMYKSQKSEDK